MTILGALALLVGFNVLAVALMLGIKHFAPRGGFFEDTQQVAGVFSVVGTTFAVLLAFVFLLTFQSFDDGRDASENEAAAVVSLFRTAGIFTPQPEAERIEGDLICYGRSVVSLEWPAMRNSGASETTDGWLALLDRDFKRVRIKSSEEDNAYSSWFDQSLQRQGGRQERLEQSKPFIPGLVWFLIGVCAVVVCSFVGLFADARERSIVQALMIVAVTTVIGAGLLMVRYFDDAYSGGTGSVQPLAMERALHLVHDEQRAARTRAVVRCDAQGRPVKT